MPLDYVNSVPLHIQLKEELRQKVKSGEYQAKIPSERELMNEYRLSRSTVRQSIDQLVQEGILEKRRGKGTFVAFKPIHDWLGSLSSTSEVIERMNMQPGAKLNCAEILVLNPFLRKRTGLKNAYYFERVRFANQVAVGIERHYYPVSLGDRLIQYDLNEAAFYDLLENELGVKTFSANQTIKATLPTKADARLLNISPNTSVLNVERIVTGLNGEFIEYENALYRGDMYTLNITSSRKNS